MKFLVTLFTISILIFCAHSQALNLKGYVYVDEAGYSFIHTETLVASPIQPASSLIAHDLSKLKSFDSLVGSGYFTDNNRLVLESIDFVALRRLLGLWKANSAVVNFVDYTRVNFRLPNALTQYNYAMTPAPGNSWRIFFTDSSSVVLGAVAIEERTAKIEIYDPHTGEVSQRLELQKVQ